MVATVGSISIDLSTNAAKFATGMRGAATTVERESGRMSKSLAAVERSSLATSAALKSLGSGALAAAGIGSLTALVGKARDAIGQLDDIADRAKSSGLGTDLLQSLEHGAQQAGVEVDALSGGLQFFAKGMGQAAEGTGRLYAGLLKLNPELLRSLLHATDQEERLKAVANALDKTRTATERAALSAALFGDVDFGRLFEGGAAGIDKMVAAMDGKLFTPEQIKRAGEYDTALNDIAKHINTNLSKAFVELGPVIVAAAKSLDYFIDRQRDSIEHIGPAIDVLGEAFGLVGDVFSRDLASQIAAVSKNITTLQKQIMKDTAVGIDTTDAERTLAKLQSQAADLRADLTETMKIDIDSSEAKAAIADLAQAFRESENASMAALAAMHPQAAPRVIGGGNAIDPAIMDDVERAIDKGTVSTDRTTQAVGGLGSALQSSGGGGGPLSYSVPAGGGYATGDAANSFKFSGLGKASSWGGKRMTFGGGGGGGGGGSPFSGPMASNYDYYAGALNRPMGARAAMDTSSITPGGGAPATSVVNVVVKPTLVGERLSVQSRAEIKQAASEGANAALRGYHGR